MGLCVYLKILTEEDAEIDLDPMNEELMRDRIGFGELYEVFTSFKEFTGPFHIDEDGTLLIAMNSEGNFEGYDHYTNIWGCYSSDTWATIAKHLISGKIVLELDIEGNNNEYIIITPSAWQSKSITEFLSLKTSS